MLVKGDIRVSEVGFNLMAKPSAAFAWWRWVSFVCPRTPQVLQTLPDAMAFVQAASSAFGGSGQMYDPWYVVMPLRSPADSFAVFLDSDMTWSLTSSCCGRRGE
jgi:hypothetical protein